MMRRSTRPEKESRRAQNRNSFCDGYRPPTLYVYMAALDVVKHSFWPWRGSYPRQLLILDNGTIVSCDGGQVTNKWDAQRVSVVDGPGNVFFLSGCGGVCGCGTQTLRFEAVNVDQKYALLLSVGQLPQSATPVDPGGWHGGSTPPASPPSAERSSSGRALGVYTPYPSEPQGAALSRTLPLNDVLRLRSLPCSDPRPHVDRRRGRG